MVRLIEMQQTGAGRWRMRPQQRTARRGLGYVSPNGVTGTLLSTGYVQYPGATLGLPSDVFASQGQPVYGPLFPPPGVQQTQAFDYTGALPPAAPAPQTMQYGPQGYGTAPAPPATSTAVTTFNPSNSGQNTGGPPAAPQTTQAPPAPAPAPDDAAPFSLLDIVGDPSGKFSDLIGRLPAQIQDALNAAGRFTPMQWAAVAGIAAVVIFEKKKGKR